MPRMSFKINKEYKTFNGCRVKHLGLEPYSDNPRFILIDNNGNSASVGVKYTTTKSGFHPSEGYSVIGDIEHTNKRSRLY